MNIHQPLFAATRDWFSAHRALRAPARGPGLRTEHNGMSAGRLTGTVRIISPHEKRLRGVSQIEWRDDFDFRKIRGNPWEVSGSWFDWEHTQNGILKMDCRYGRKKKKLPEKERPEEFFRTFLPNPGPWTPGPLEPKPSSRESPSGGGEPLDLGGGWPFKALGEVAGRRGASLSSCRRGRSSSGGAARPQTGAPSRSGARRVAAPSRLEVPALGRGALQPLPALGRGASQLLPALERGALQPLPALGRGASQLLPALGRGALQLLPALGRGASQLLPALGRRALPALGRPAGPPAADSPPGEASWR